MAAKTTAACPNLYTIISEREDKSSLSVAVINSFADDAFDIEFELEREYGSVRFVNCIGSLAENKVTIDYMEPYSFAAFEVKYS